MANAIFGLRVWMALITSVNLCIVIATYAWLVPYSKSNIMDPDDGFNYNWTDIAILTASSVLFLAYLYSIWGKPRLHKFARAPLMLLPALFLLGVQLHQIQLQVKFVNMLNERNQSRMDGWEIPPMKPFSCGDMIDAPCGILQSWTFIPVIVGFFAVIEVFVTLLRGPLQPANQVDF
ncbi:hypothetical protein BGW39_007981 [Mortierella sp. 14UC]|nr:hypothetical protein BGW39_007981 [Mortierella sp. 14UC]